MLPKTIHLLLEGTPEHLSITDMIFEMEKVDGMESIHHVHIWQLDEHHSALEAHVVIKQRLNDQSEINHSTLEIEFKGSDCDPANGR